MRYKKKIKYKKDKIYPNLAKALQEALKNAKKYQKRTPDNLIKHLERTK